MHVMRSLIGAVMALMLVFTSLSAGVARGTATPVGVVEICEGVTSVSLTVDAQGKPVRHVHLCPDGVMSLVTQTVGPIDFVAPVSVWVAVSPVMARVAVTGRGGVVARARGPPLALIS